MNCMKTASFAVLFLVAPLIIAQAIAPPMAEYRSAKIDGMLEVQNGMDYPMAALVETKSFDVDGRGQVHYRSLAEDMHVSLGATSFIIRPHDTHMVFYKASVPTAPCSFAIIVTMTRAKAAEGMRINYVLPHMIYIYQKEKLNRADIKVDTANGVLHIQNLSQKLGRISGVHAPKQDLGAFPLYPGQTREVAVTGNRMTVQFEDGFKIDLK